MPSRKSNETKLLIADTAEMLFSRRGFRATTVRDIFDAAQLNQGLMTYYFRSKEELYAFVVTRRAAQLKDLFIDNFPAATRDGRPCPPEIFIGYYFRFFLINALVEKNDISNYILLLAKSSLDYDEEYVRKILYKFDFISEKMVSSLRKCAPFVDEAKVRSAVFYMEAAVTTMIVSHGLREHRLGEGDEQEKMLHLIEDTTHFFSRGFLR